MIAVETVIKKLVSDYEFVIIPGFGALLSRQVPAIYNQDSGIFSPPVKKLAFNEFLKLDDGFLANYISREEKIAHADAIIRIKEYTEQLKSGLVAKGETNIEGIGVFNTNGEGKLVFEPNVANCFKDEWYGFSKIKVKTVERKTPAQPVVSGSVNSDVHVEVLELDSRSSLKTGSWLKWASAAVIAGLMFYVSFFLMNSGSGNNKSTLNPFDFSNENTESVVMADDVQPVVEVPAPVVEEVTETIAKPDSASLIAKPNIAPAAVVLKPVTGKRFYLIAGTFNGMKRANILLADLQNKGFSEALVIPAAGGSKKVKVAVQGFEIESEAHAAASKLKAVIGEPGWVLKM